MTSFQNPVVVIPARMASTRLPGKPLADIHGMPMIVHVWRRAIAADIGEVIVACAERELADAIEKSGGRAVLTDPDLPSGSDRIHQAITAIDPGRTHDIVVNLQGDLPAIDPAVIGAVLRPLEESAVDLSTLAAPIIDPAEETNPNVVKIALSLDAATNTGRALYFSRAPIPAGDGPRYHHIGIYGFRRNALDQFVSLAPGALEWRESLEQLRALENGMRIDVALVDTVPLGVDTPADLERARQLLAAGLS